jgi:hypothetical protein
MDIFEPKIHIILITLIYLFMFTPLACLSLESWICNYSIDNIYLSIEHLIIVFAGIFLRKTINSFRNTI